MNFKEISDEIGYDVTFFADVVKGEGCMDYGKYKNFEKYFLEKCEYSKNMFKEILSERNLKFISTVRSYVGEPPEEYNPENEYKVVNYKAYYKNTDMIADVACGNMYNKKFDFLMFDYELIYDDNKVKHKDLSEEERLMASDNYMLLYHMVHMKVKMEALEHYEKITENKLELLISDLRTDDGTVLLNDDKLCNGCIYRLGKDGETLHFDDLMIIAESHLIMLIVFNQLFDMFIDKKYVN